MKDLECKICGIVFLNKRLYSSHIRHKHKITYIKYYDMYIKHPNEGVCINCGGSTKYIPGRNKYNTYCSNKCAGSSSIKESKRITTNIKRFGVAQPALRVDIKDALSLKLKEINNNNTDAIYNKRTIKRKETNNKKFGVDFPMQNPIYFKKCMKHQWTRKYYVLPSGIKIQLQGYEPQFLDYIFNNTFLEESEINYKPDRIAYITTDNRNHYYYPDFFISKYNLIIEIKSSYTYKVDKNRAFKETACIAVGYNYICIIDSDYSPLTRYL